MPALRSCRATIIAAALALCAARALAASEQPRGLWPLPRKDPCNTARADVAGKMKAAPQQVWSYGCVREQYGCLKPVTVKGRKAFLVQVRDGLRLLKPNGTRIWNRPLMGVSRVVDVLEPRATAGPRALVALGTDRLALVDLAGGQTTWSWTVPTGSYLNTSGTRLCKEANRTRLVVFPQNCMHGFCFDLTGKPKLTWRKDYTGNYWPNFGPSLVLADMDNDRAPDIVLAGKPGYAAVLDLDTGVVKFDAHYEITGGDHLGRPYGLLRAVDIDGDGYRDVVVASCQVEMYISVLRNQGGKGLSLAWSRLVGLDFPVQEKELRPSINSLADVNGDGKLEFIVGLRNEKGDGRWHTIVFDAFGGCDARLADLPDRYFWGCYDLDRDGRAEIITSTEKSSRFTMPAQIQAVDGKTFQDVAALEETTLPFLETQPPDDTAFMSNRNTPIYLAKPDGVRGLLVSRGDDSFIWHVVRGKSILDPVRWTAPVRALVFSQGSDRIPPTGTVIPWPQAPKGPSASGPLVAVANRQRELILSLSDGTIIGGTPNLSHSGAFKNHWTMRGTMPSVWLSPDTSRILAAADPSDDVIAFYEPALDSRSQDIHSSHFKLPWPLRRRYTSRSTADLLLFGAKELRLFVGMLAGTAHAVASALYGSDGQCIWSDTQNGPYPRIAAAADLDGDGKEEVIVDNHGRHIIYNPQGKGKLVAAGWQDEIPGRSDGAKYAVPIVGPFGPNGALRIVMAGGLDALETLDASGKRISKRDFASCYEFEWCGPAVARMRTTGEWDVGTANGDGIFFCNDVETCKTRWTLPLGAKATSPINVSSGDVDGDGRDNFLVGLPNGELVCLDEKNGKGFILWKKKLDAAVNEAIFADVDGDGVGEVIAELADGRVTLLK